MAATTSIILGGLSAFSAISSVMGGMAANEEAGKQAQLAASQAESRAVEQERLAFKEAQATTEEADSVARRQKVAYLASGVDLAGSPLLVMEETRRKGAENADEIVQAGKYGASASRAEGRAQASQLKSSGRQALIGGLINAAGSASQGVQQYRNIK